MAPARQGLLSQIISEAGNENPINIPSGISKMIDICRGATTAGARTGRRSPND
jgi:hypothetical protein